MNAQEAHDHRADARGLFFGCLAAVARWRYQSDCRYQHSQKTVISYAETFFSFGRRRGEIYCRRKSGRAGSGWIERVATKIAGEIAAVSTHQSVCVRAARKSASAHVCGWAKAW